ncbi:MAG: 1-deoxy-D-xylulose-5-phosphate synthase [Clostridiales bacterium]|nr:1-deoxy-D-xylulose-5-phosphate synthase [Clostridiales bacterium]
MNSPEQPLLPQINSPEDLRKLDLPQLKILAQEIRDYMLAVVSVNGGHLAPNLGVVELTLALHTVFDTPSDQLIWDVGHQCYAHKIITGRRDQFPTLRQAGGLAGFPKREESPYDAFDTGHSSTSLSLATAFAASRDLQGQKHHVVAVIGDGALTGGMAYEALNHLGDLQTGLTIVLNDNEMSIDQNVGAMSNYLVRMRTDPRYGKTKKDLEQLLRKIPRVGPQVAKTIDRFKDSLKHLLVPGMLFEEMGLVYLGPVDGHDIAALRRVLKRAKQMDKPVLVHVLTRKGQGYAPARENPDKFHGIGPFDLASGQVKENGSGLTYTQVFGETLAALAAADPKIISLTAAMSAGAGLDKFTNIYPERAFDVGIAEQHALTFAAGLAACGFRPVAAIYSSFLQRGYDQILHDICLPNLPVTLAIDRAGIVGEDGPTHQGIFDLSYLGNLPNLVLMAPKDEQELQQMLATALAYPGPAALRYPRDKGRGLSLLKDPQPLPVGRAEILREGKDLTIFALGSMVYPALEAAEILARQEIEATVLNARFVKPLDQKTLLQTVKTTGCLLTVEENVQSGGFGQACLTALQGKVQARVEIAALANQFVPQGKRAELLEQAGLTGQKLAQRALLLLGGRG